ncbi:MAG: hypothetical protein KatS3mg115_0469 [Candidatus Poribacteria bacterium]|nr:MAG: hypothetical protein KatS3mg115_0469 [Candidatus Poribacteria bacterium]
MARRFLRVLGALLLLLPPGAGGVEWTGYAKHFLLVSDRPGSGEPVSGLATTRVRLAVRWEPLEAIRAELAYGLIPQVGGGGLSQLFAGGGLAYRIGDLSEALYPSEEQRGGLVVRQNLDRLNVALRVGIVDLRLGRQPVAFGSARTVNPTDVLAPFVVWALDKEERIGVDAVRARVSLGNFSELDGGAVFGEGISLQKGAAFLRTQTQALGADVSALALWFQGHRLIGLDVARSLGGASLWLEAAGYRPEEGDPFLRASLGGDYYLPSGVYGAAEYHYNGVGTTRREAYGEVRQRPIVNAAQISLVGKHYLSLSLAYSPAPLWNLSGGLIGNLSDRSALLMPRVEYNPQPDLYWELGALWGLRLLEAPAEFDERSRAVFTAMRFYF